ncbi:hypothetical protein K461DRAFT_269811 [Myriangium duriaei CBS 260.36]|uniref:Uncharacterized protein n=1 Tax=Myriangium duriaei CBS 260.36 TaxID=1168546 RepID=A0A9P4MEN5_9PEZI|nr:hypothetical protein K461DRAFT_269811 [Myriangium duriaei CBS 260.36]
MARLQGLLLFFALLVAVYGAATPKHYRAKFCKNHHGAIKKVRNSFAYPREFCLWYNSALRTHAPFEHLPYTQVTNACECIMEAKPSKKPTDFTAPDDFAPVCDNALKRKLAGITYAQPKNFCKFWGNGAGAHFRKVGPFHKQGLTNMDTYNACACYDLFTYGNPTTTTTGTDEQPSATNTDEQPSATTTNTDEQPSATITNSDVQPSATVTDADNSSSASSTGTDVQPSATVTDADISSSATPSATGSEVDSSSASPTPAPTSSQSADSSSSTSASTTSASTTNAPSSSSASPSTTSFSAASSSTSSAASSSSSSA